MNDLTASVVLRLEEMMPPVRDAMRHAMARRVVADGAAVKGVDEDEWAVWFNELMMTPGDARNDELHEHMQAIIAHREANP